MTNATIEIDFADRIADGQRVGWTRWDDDGAMAGTTELLCSGPVVRQGDRFDAGQWQELTEKLGRRSPGHNAVYDPRGTASECIKCGLQQWPAAFCGDCGAPLADGDRVRPETSTR